MKKFLLAPTILAAVMMAGPIDASVRIPAGLHCGGHVKMLETKLELPQRGGSGAVSVKTYDDGRTEYFCHHRIHSLFLAEVIDSRELDRHEAKGRCPAPGTRILLEHMETLQDPQPIPDRECGRHRLSRAVIDALPLNEMKPGVYAGELMHPQIIAIAAGKRPAPDKAYVVYSIWGQDGFTADFTADKGLHSENRAYLRE
ncbi:MAG: hypothetical protein FWF01_04305, partial [Alphaproteobacteria bacterium]|nr:hypothetical protein [Alphaproteobacteria bacterium]